jgi:hypothetical protein
MQMNKLIFKFNLTFFFWIFSMGLIFFFLNCNEIKRPGLESLLLFQGSPNAIGVVTSDFGGGGRYNVIDPNVGYVYPGLTPIHSDANARFANGKIFIINRLNRDSIQILNPNAANLTESEFSVGQGTNPQDILIYNNDKAYISRYNSKKLLIANPYNGQTLGEIDLSAYSETSSAGGIPDGKPEMSWMIRFDDRIFITLQVLDRNHPQGFFPPSGNSLLLEINPNNDTVVRTIPFLSTNPFSKPQIVEIFGERHIVFTTPGKLGFISELDGGIEAFNPRTNSFRNEFLLKETTAGGDILGFQIKNNDLGFASVLDKNFNKRIFAFNPSNGQIISLLFEVASNVGTNFSGILLTQEGQLAIGISDFSNPGIHIFDTNGSIRQLTLTPIRTQLTPVDIIELK